MKWLSPGKGPRCSAPDVVCLVITSSGILGDPQGAGEKRARSPGGVVIGVVRGEGEGWGEGGPRDEGSSRGSRDDKKAKTAANKVKKGKDAKAKKAPVKKK